MANHYNIWVEKYGKEEADKREAVRIEKLRAARAKWSLEHPKKVYVKKGRKSTSGEKNPMYGKTVLQVWTEKYGEEIAKIKWKELCINRGINLKEKLSMMTPEERSKKYGTSGEQNSSKRPAVRELISRKVNEYWADDSRSAKMRKKLSEKMIGDKNPLKRPEVAEKISEARKEWYKDPQHRLETSLRTIELHEQGRSSSGYTKNYRYTIGNKEYILQGTYELAFIKYLEKNNLKFRCHEDRIKYTASDGTPHHYLPDFYVYDWDSFVDVKSSYWYSVQEKKFNDILNSNPNLKLKILLENDLKELKIL